MQPTLPPHPAARAGARGPMHGAAAAALLALALLLGACAEPETLPPAAGGLARGDAARLSLLVRQTRAQFPELSAAGLRQGPQRTPPGDVTERASLTLVGEGQGFRPGVQVEAPQRIRLALYLDKTAYSAGYARVTLDDAPEADWRVVAHDLRGNTAEDFELILMLADAAGTLRYMVVLGGTYAEGDARWRAFEGTLVVPGAGLRIDRWERLYKIDFGFRYPAVPLYVAEVNQAAELFTRLDRDMRQLETLRRQVRDAEQALDAAETEQQTESRRQALNQARARFGSERDRARDALLRYYRLRREIAAHYAEYSESNPYRWKRLAAQQADYDHWKQVEFHHPRIDAIHDQLAGYDENRENLDQARRRMLDVVNRHNNWGRDPSGQRGPPEGRAEGEAP